MNAEEIQNLLLKNGVRQVHIARALKVDPSVVSRTISGHACSSSRVRLYISSITGYMPSKLFNLSFADQLYEDFKFCEEKSKKQENQKNSYLIEYTGSDSAALS